MELSVSMDVPIGEDQPVLLKHLINGQENTLASVVGSCALLSAEEPDSTEPTRLVVEVMLKDDQGKPLGVILLPPQSARHLAGQLLHAVHSIVSVDPSSDPDTEARTGEGVPGPTRGEA